MDRKWWTLISVCTGMFMLLMDITVVNVALPDIQRALNASFSELEWVVNAYALTLAALLLTAGAIADLLGRRRVFVAGLVLFTASSLLCGLSGSILMLNIARAAQGIGGAIMFATSLALIANAFHGHDRGIAFGVYGAVIGAAVALGPLVGGLLTSGIGWEWIFFVNVPIGVIAVAVTLMRVEESSDPEARGVDWLGLITFSGSLFLVVFSLIEGNDRGWGSALILACLSASAALLAAFVAVESRQARPMLDLGLFRVKAFAGVSLSAFALSASMFAMFLYLTLYIQNVLGYSPLEAGLRFLPISLLSFLAAPISGRLTARVPIRLIVGVGLTMVGIGLALMSGLSAGSDWTHLLPGFLVAGIGIGLANPALASTAVGVVPHSRSGMASGINNTFRQTGIATGIAGLGAIFQHEVASRTMSSLAAGGHAQAVISGTHGHLQSTFASGQTGQLAASLPPGPRQALLSAFDSAFAAAMNEILVIAAVVALLGAVAGLALVRRADFVSGQTGPAAGAEDPVAANAAG